MMEVERWFHRGRVTVLPCFSSTLLWVVNTMMLILLNQDRTESWLAPSLSLDVVTPPVSIKDRLLPVPPVIVI
jgi:hypothetical protein